jgi:hypothetical protein
MRANNKNTNCVSNQSPPMKYWEIVADKLSAPGVAVDGKIP